MHHPTPAAGRERQNASTRPDGDINALCALAAAQPQSFLDNLEWTVSDDLACLADIDTGVSHAEPFQSAQWLGAWNATIGATRSAEPAVICASFGGHPLIVVPLCTEKRGPLRRARFMAQGVSDYNDPLFHRQLEPYVTPVLMGAVWTRVAAMLPGTDYLTLNKMPREVADPRNGEPWRYCSAEIENSHWFAITGPWEESEDRFFGSSSRHSMKRKAKKLARIGELACGTVEGTEARLRAMDKLIEWKTQQLSHLGAANRFLDASFLAFLRQLARKGDPSVHKIYALSAGDEILAVTYMICSSQRWFLYQTSYTNEDAGRFSPGLLLSRHLIRDAHEAGVQVFDFGLGNEGYKQRFCDQHMTLYGANIPITPLGRVAVGITDSYAWLRDFARTHPVVRKPVLAALRMLAAIRGKKGSA